MVEKDCLVSFLCVTCLKFLFIPFYKSTDFEVHRNWMAVTYSKNITDWYFEDTSEWTLDYPPFFAWFEYFLAFFAKYFDGKMLEIENLNYSSSQTVFFMRISVIISDIIYFYGVSRICALVKEPKSKSDDPWIHREVILAMLLLWNPGLLIVDHIHFQYNGFLTGILFISIADMMEEKCLLSTFWFSVLINLKHIYLYIAPAYFLFLLKNYCFKKSSKGFEFSPENFVKLAIVGLSTTLVSFGPFIYLGQLKQVLSRMFPIKRGLTHSYWAPNIWALYNFTDKILSMIASFFKIHDGSKTQGCTTSGLVQVCSFEILPNISSAITILFAFASFIPVFWLIWKGPSTSKVFLNSIVLCCFGSFLFGYHVHEKAILMMILPLTITAVAFKEDVHTYLFLSTVGHFSLFPLLYQEGETVLKIALYLLHIIYSFSVLQQLYKFKTTVVSAWEKIYFCGFFVLQIFYSFGNKVMGTEKSLPFLPLMLISIYCACGVLYAWLNYLKLSMNRIKHSFSKTY